MRIVQSKFAPNTLNEKCFGLKSIHRPENRVGLGEKESPHSRRVIVQSANWTKVFVTMFCLRSPSGRNFRISTTRTWTTVRTGRSTTKPPVSRCSRGSKPRSKGSNSCKNTGPRCTVSRTRTKSFFKPLPFLPPFFLLRSHPVAIRSHQVREKTVVNDRLRKLLLQALIVDCTLFFFNRCALTISL